MKKLKHTEARKSFKQHEQTVDKIDKLVAKWVGDLWLGQWDIKAVYKWNGISEVDGAPSKAAACCQANWKYMHAEVRIDVPQFSTMSDAEMEDCIVHELLHAVVHEMRSEGIDHEERVVSHLQRVVCFLARRGKK